MLILSEQITYLEVEEYPLRATVGLYRYILLAPGTFLQEEAKLLAEPKLGGQRCAFLPCRLGYRGNVERLYFAISPDIAFRPTSMPFQGTPAWNGLPRANLNGR